MTPEVCKICGIMDTFIQGTLFPVCLNSKLLLVIEFNQTYNCHYFFSHFLLLNAGQTSIIFS